MEDAGFDAALQRFRARHSAADANTALGIMHKLIENMMAHPEDRKFRTVNKANKVLAAKIFRLEHAEAVLIAAGFVPEGTDSLLFTGEDFTSADIADTLIQVTLSELAEELMTTEERKALESRRKREHELKEKTRQQEEHKRRILEEAKQDRLEASKRLMPSKDSVATKRGCGKQVSYGDIGVDLNKKGG
jgi:hypothetical protein